MNQQLVVITHQNDIHADKLLARFEGKVFRLNIDMFPADYSFSFKTHDKQAFPFGSIRCLKTDKEIDTSSISAIWTRKPAEYSFSDTSLHPQELAYAKQETEYAFKGFLHCLECFWVNHPLANRSANWKQEQQIRAHRMGFKVLDLLITNSPETVKDFYNDAKDGIVLKSLSSPFLGADKVGSEDIIHRSGLPTTKISAEHLDKIETVRLFPTSFQAFLDKVFDLRVTVIGSKVFAAKICSQDDERTRIDFRNYEADIRYEHYILPHVIEKRCLDFVHSYGLEYGAIDLLVDVNGDYYFLENNPAGEFWFIEERVPTLNMMETLAKTLLAGARL